MTLRSRAGARWRASPPPGDLRRDAHQATAARRWRAPAGIDPDLKSPSLAAGVSAAKCWATLKDMMLACLMGAYLARRLLALLPIVASSPSG
jgi:hypothetical protein